jgi:hypothetical protein
MEPLVNIRIDQSKPEWWTEYLLSKQLLDGEEIIDLEVEKKETVTSFVYSITFRFSRESAKTKQLSNLFIKEAKENFANDNEVVFYNAVSEHIDQLGVPKCVEAVNDNSLRKSLIVLENISATHQAPVEPYPMPPKMELMKGAINTLAQLHALWWDNEGLETKLGFSPEKVKQRISLIKERQIIKKAFDFLGENLSKSRRELVERIDDDLGDLVWKRFEEKKNITLNHGDSHFWNFMFPKGEENKKIYLIDWQGWKVSSPLQDLSYMIFLHWYPERRGRFEKELLKFYYEKLLAYGVTNYSWEECWWDYRFSALQNVIVPFWQCINKIPGVIWWGHLERYFQNFDDLGLADFLEN